jgi:hypothetical protein
MLEMLHNDQDDDVKLVRLKVTMNIALSWNMTRVPQKHREIYIALCDITSQRIIFSAKFAFI